MLQRLSDHLLVSPEDVPPTRPDFRVIGTFNPGVVRWRGTTYILIRVVEAPADVPEGHMAFPRWDFPSGGSAPAVDLFATEALDISDHREIFVRETGLVRLPFLSHLRLATSRDGLKVDWIDPEPTVIGAGPLEEYGVEDARITLLEGENRCAITYVTPSRHGVATSLMTTRDFRNFERHGVIFTTENKDVVVFPDRRGGLYGATHRPLSRMPIHKPEIWYAESPDLVHWGGHRVLLSEKRAHFRRIGAGAPPVKLPEGYLEIYHGALATDPQDRVGTYCAAAVLLDLDEPWRIRAACEEPLLVPTSHWERNGYTPNILFPTAAVVEGDRLLLYSGAADERCIVTELRLSDVLASLARWTD